MGNFVAPSYISIWLACCLVLSFFGSAKSHSAEVHPEVELSSPTSHYTIVTNKLSWNDAQHACALNGSHLVCVNSAEESELLHQAVLRSELPTKYYWMGLVVVEDGEWEWQDGRRLGYTNWWDMGGSSGLGSESDEDSICVTVYMRTQRWRTKKCSKNNYYICEREFANATVTQPILAEDTTLADTRIPQSTTVMGDGRAAPPHSASNGDSTEHVCPDGFELFESSCYYLLSETLTDGYNSRNACAINVQPGSHLAFIESRSIQTFLKSLIMLGESTVDFWFGLTYTSDEDHPEWLDGRTLGNFTSWDRFGVFDEKSPCVRLRRRSDYSWNDRPCTGHEFGSVCEIEKTQAVTPTPAVTAPPAPSPQTKEAVFKASPSNMAAPTGSHHLQSMSALSLFRCATFCLRHNNCASFNYKSAEGRDKLSSFCELYSMHFPDEELTVKPGYRYYRV